MYLYRISGAINKQLIYKISVGTRIDCGEFLGQNFSEIRKAKGSFLMRYYFFRPKINTYSQSLISNNLCLSRNEIVFCLREVCAKQNTHTYTNIPIQHQAFTTI